MVPIRTVQEAVAAGDLPPLDADAANVFSRSERILQDHARKHNTNATELKDLIQRVLHHPDFWMCRYIWNLALHDIIQGGVPGVFQHV